MVPLGTAPDHEAFQAIPLERTEEDYKSIFVCCPTTAGQLLSLVEMLWSRLFFDVPFAFVRAAFPLGGKFVLTTSIADLLRGRA